jgi:hypothetical protein
MSPSQPWQPPKDYIVLYFIHQQKEFSFDQDSHMKENAEKIVQICGKVLVNQGWDVNNHAVRDKYCGYK